MLAFAEVVRRLRAECPWKAAQTHRSLVRHLLEETHETVEAIETGDPSHLREELGDLLLQVFLHAAVAEQAGDFTLDDVAREVTAKMVRRNPHVLGPGAGQGPPLSADEVDAAWETLKAEEKSHRHSVADGIPPTLPALLRAQKVLDRLERAGTDPGSGADHPDLGERMLALVQEARAAGTDPEQALRTTVRRLEARADAGTTVVRLSGRLVCHSDEEAGLVAQHLPEHTALTRAEPGCLSFDVSPTDDPWVWAVEERFRDQESLAAHVSRAADSPWGRATSGIERRYSIDGAEDAERG